VVKGLPLKHREFFQSLRTYPSCAEAKIKRGAALEACYCYVISVEKSEVNRTILKSWWDQTQTGNLIEIRRIGCFDLVFGGSPCNNLAGSNPTEMAWRANNLHCSFIILGFWSL
jgi:hypothetical protein